MNKKCNCPIMPPFWIHVKWRNLTVSKEGEGAWNSTKDISYHCSDYFSSVDDNPAARKDLMENGFDLTCWFYKTLERLENKNKDGKYNILEIAAFPGDKFHFCEDDRVESKCDKGCEDEYGEDV